jgi:acyl-[acyl-carrier-protein]-phospholipid O-acyltransferase / long-chain-fatty-acid--[acyl-carrier-protein] ligase
MKFKLKKTLDEFSFSSPTDGRSLGYLNATQFFGALNDNVFKLFVIFLLISTLGEKQTNLILSLAGAIFVIPFILFSHAAGVLSDRFRKQTILVTMKAWEIAIMLLAFFSFGFKSTWGCYTLLFLLATQAAIFGPPKYSIIPELVKESKVPKANGLITGFTYLAIILGTFIASFITEITNYNFYIGITFCLFIAIAGFLTSMRIRKTPAQGSSKKVNPFFLLEVLKTLKFCKDKRHLLIVMFSSAYFLFIGAFTQLNIIPYAIESLKLPAVAGGYLFLAVAIGIAIGSYIAGKACRQRIDLSLPPIASLIIGFFFLTLYFSSQIVVTVIALIFIGMAGGFFIVPLDSFVQVYSPEEKRGEIVATTNFLSFSGVFLASLFLFVFGKSSLSAGGGFAIFALMTFSIGIILFLRLSEFTLYFISRKFLKKIFNVHTIDADLIKSRPQSLLILEEPMAMKALLLTGLLPYLHFYIPQKIGKRHRLAQLFYSIHPLEDESDLKMKENGEEIKCLYGKEGGFPRGPVIFVSIKREGEDYSFWRALFSKNETIVTFSKEAPEKVSF